MNAMIASMSPLCAEDCAEDEVRNEISFSPAEPPVHVRNTDEPMIESSQVDVLRHSLQAHSLQDVLTAVPQDLRAEARSSNHEHPEHALMLECHAANELIVSLLDNADEYRRAIFAVEELLNNLQRRLFNRVQAAEQLQNHVRSLGMEPATSRSSLAAEFAARVETPRLFTGNRQDEFLQDVERGQRSLVRQFNRCLQQDWLSSTGRECLKQTFERLSTDSDRATSANPSFSASSFSGTFFPRLTSVSTLSSSGGAPIHSFSLPPRARVRFGCIERSPSAQ